MQKKKSVYLYPTEDSTYAAAIVQCPSTDAIFLVEEGPYPTVAYHQRHDLNMDAILVREEIKNREELFAYLDFIGKCRNKLLSLWDYNADKFLSNELHELFSKCIERKADMFYEAMMEVCEDMDEQPYDDYDYGNGPDENVPF